MTTTPASAPDKHELTESSIPSQELSQHYTSRELVFGIVGHVGSGTSTVSETLLSVLQNSPSEDDNYECVIIKAREVIREWAQLNEEILPSQDSRSVSVVEQFQDLGDKMRSAGDHAAVAKGAIQNIRRERARMQEIPLVDSQPVIPDGQRRAYVIDSLRHPAEVQLLRHVYRDAFVLIGVVCEHTIRKSRLSKKYEDAGDIIAERFMKRDAKGDKPFGQRVSDAFHLSDFFVDNTASRLLAGDPSRANPHWDINDHLTRLIRLVTHEEIERPTVDETAMFSASGAAMRSSCLSRQVGAALLDKNGNIVATGTNEVPRAGGGVYGEHFGETSNDDRCFVTKKHCSNTKEQTAIAKAIVHELREHFRSGTDLAELEKTLKTGRVGELLEFSRAVHAEMDALLDAGRQGVSPAGCRMYVTTFPCHYCARHIVAAGIDEVQFIEPYPKSRALALHDDSILTDRSIEEWQPPSETGVKVLFRPFTGVAPRMYSRAFRKNQTLKNDVTGDLDIVPPDWGSPYDTSKVSYAEFELKLALQLLP